MVIKRTSPGGEGEAPEMKVTITADDGTVYDTFTVDCRNTRLGWVLTDSTGDPVTVDEALSNAAEWVEKETGEVVQR